MMCRRRRRRRCRCSRARQAKQSRAATRRPEWRCPSDCRTSALSRTAANHPSSVTSSVNPSLSAVRYTHQDSGNNGRDDSRCSTRMSRRTRASHDSSIRNNGGGWSGIRGIPLHIHTHLALSLSHTPVTTSTTHTTDAAAGLMPQSHPGHVMDALHPAPAASTATLVAITKRTHRFPADPCSPPPPPP